MARKILVIDDQVGTRKFLTLFLEERGYQVITAEDGEQGLALFRQERPLIVFTDVRMPKMDGIQFLKAAQEIHSGAHIVLLTAFATEEHLLQALRYGATNLFTKPLDLKEVGECLKALENRTKIVELGTHFDYSFVVEERRVIEIPNDLKNVSGVVSQITDMIIHYFDDQTVHGIQGALIEMIVNAIEHGNLGITYEEKTKALDNDTLKDLIDAKSQEPHIKKRIVRISYKMERDKVTYLIEDEGDGFSIDDLPDPGDPKHIWLGHGRGILMTRALMDEVTYNTLGNQVTLVKHLPKIEIDHGTK